MLHNREPVMYQANQTSFSLSNQSSPQKEPYFNTRKQPQSDEQSSSQILSDENQQNNQQESSQQQSSNNQQQSKQYQQQNIQSARSQSQEDNSIDHLQQRIRKLQLTLSGAGNDKKTQSKPERKQSQQKKKIGWYKQHLDKENLDLNIQSKHISEKKPMIQKSNSKNDKNIKQKINIKQNPYTQNSYKQNSYANKESKKKIISSSKVASKKQSIIKTERSLSNTIRSSRTTTLSKIKQSQIKQQLPAEDHQIIKLQQMQNKISDLLNENKLLKKQIARRNKENVQSGNFHKKNSIQIDQKLGKQIQLLQVLDTLHAKLSKSIHQKQKFNGSLIKQWE